VGERLANVAVLLTEQFGSALASRDTPFQRPLAVTSALLDHAAGKSSTIVGPRRAILAWRGMVGSLTERRQAHGQPAAAATTAQRIVDRIAQRDEDGNVVFAHESEAEFAKILDFYQIRWEYEPRSFAIEWDETGAVVRYFTPDFYLPELDLYVELTTLRQKLVTKKNQKIRRLRELYPDITIKLFYRRDIKRLFAKYGVRLPANLDTL
jgi:hypothetical protein